MEALFEFLFKYRPVVFEKGRLAFAAGPATYFVIALALAIALPALVAYARIRLRGGPRDRAVLLALRLAALAIIVIALLHPVLVVSEAVPRRNVVGVLVDDSRSMRIADLNGTTRADAVRHLLGSRDSSLYAALAQSSSFGSSVSPATVSASPNGDLLRWRSHAARSRARSARQDSRAFRSPDWCSSPTAPTTRLARSPTR